MDPFFDALQRLATGDRELWEIVALSLRVSATAVVLACAIGLPLGALVAVARFPGRGALRALLNGFMGLPPVVVGLAVYLALSRSGPFGALGLLYTPTAMIVAQTLLVTPIVAALAAQTLEDLMAEIDEELRALKLGPGARMATALWEGRLSLATAALAGFGRAVAEVGAVMIVGGNIDHHTRVMTTAIALETSRGALSLALGLGMVLILLSVLASAAVGALRGAAVRGGA